MEVLMRTLKSFLSLKRFLGLLLCVGLVLGLAMPAMSDPAKPVDLAQKNKAIVLRYAKEGWGTNPNWEKVWDELVAPDMVLHFNSFPDPIVGLEANKVFSKDLFEGFPKITNRIEDIVAEGDTVIYRSTLEGKQTGPFLGMPITNKSVKMNDFTMMKLRDGKIVEQWYETNLLSLMQQLGLMPESK
jgi:predicted ester cyclase